MIVLISGSTGAGKTTYSRKLARKLPGIVYSIDNWMKALYGQDMPTEPTSEWFQKNHEWYVERIQRCEEHIRSLTLDRALIDQSSILDLGFSTSDHRKSFIDFYKQSEIEVQTHFLNIPANIRWERVQKRNSEKGSTFVMNVDRTLFDYMEGIFEKPSSNEGAPLMVLDHNEV